MKEEEIEEEDLKEDYEGWLADYLHEEMILNGSLEKQN